MVGWERKTTARHVPYASKQTVEWSKYYVANFNMLTLIYKARHP
jgi:hypothetical protein